MHDSPKEHRNAPGLTQRELGEEDPVPQYLDK